jgi:hypothetical protein
MKRTTLLSLSFLLLIAMPVYSKDLQDEFRDLEKKYLDKDKPSEALDSKTVAAGLKEALSVGTKNSVATVSKVDGYFKNPLIMIPLPENVQRIARTLRSLRMNKEVDEFLLSMNRAAEKAAPKALDLFLGAVKEMTIPDAIEILRGNDTAATDYLKTKTSDKLYKAFKPEVSAMMDSVGVTHSFKKMMDKARDIPFLKDEAVDLDHYVTTKALEGLFLMVSREEAKIRKDPAARVTDLLRKVFK